MINVPRLALVGLLAISVVAGCVWAAHTITRQAETIGNQRQRLAAADAQLAELEHAAAEAEKARRVEVTALDSALAQYRAEAGRAQVHASQLRRELATERGRNDAFDTCMGMPVPDAILDRLRF
ncbi:hypothetical protein ACUN9Y_07735 [Halomonas sp. V046]|uniref:hypothetical protein n=1 Tax=Halomonas sp. V046 TaxID=3459611 RepID=UPI004044D815